MITMDGAMGEGGGQVLRTSLGLSAQTGQAFEIHNIRVKRKNPGLGRQHLTAVRAAAAICDAEICGDEVGSTRLRFVPKAVKAGEYHFSVGTAGSANLVFQTVLPALMLADGPSTVVFEGGTHNSAAPPFHFIETVFLPLLARMGVQVSVQLESWGFYPAGGGRFTATIHPTDSLQPLALHQRGLVGRLHPTVVCANLPRGVAGRELSAVTEGLGLSMRMGEVVQLKRGRGPGNVVMVTVESEQITELFASFGQRGLPAEDVAAHVCKQVKEYVAHGAPVGGFLADQLLIPLALAKSGSFRTGPLSMHTQTNIDVVERFLPVRFTRVEAPGDTWTIGVLPVRS